MSNSINLLQLLKKEEFKKYLAHISRDGESNETLGEHIELVLSLIHI